MRKTVLVVLAEGFEEIEAVTPIDVLRRADFEVTVAGVDKKIVTGAHGIPITADLLLQDYKQIPDAIVLPGGLPGAENLGKSEVLKAILKKMKAADKLIGAICAAPALVLAQQGLLDGKKATCYPGFEKYLGPAVTFSEERVVKDGKIVTSRGPGSAVEFSLELVRQLAGPEQAKTVEKGLIAKV